MRWLRPLLQFHRLAERESLQPHFSRALRATLACMAPLLLGLGGWLPVDVAFMAIAAQNLALVDLRGAYPLRLTLLLAMTAVFAIAAAGGSLVAGHLPLAVAATAGLAILGGLWRHLSPDYGPSLAVSSTLVFLLALVVPGGPGGTGGPVLAVLLGGLWGTVLHVADWPLRPQHPLRRAVSDSWVALADLFAAMQPEETGETEARALRIRRAEAAVRAGLDSAYAILGATPSPRSRLLRRRLEELNLSAARLATRTVALNTAIESAMTGSGFAAVTPALQTVLTSLTNLSRTIAIATVSRQPSHLATAEVRLRRLGHLLEVLQARVRAQASDDANATQICALLRQVAQLLPGTHAALRAMIDRADERAAFSLELLDLETWSLRPLAAALHFHRKVDPALVRFTLRVAVLTMLGVAVFKYWALPHGYWLPFTVVVVLQPDYGSTRTRAAQRVLGTFAGSLVASALLWLHPPPVLLALATAATIFAFGYWVRHNYAVAVFFVTLFIVLLTEASHPVTLAFTIERLASTLAGGALALLAALFFWPVWERHRLPPILAAAVRANRTFLGLLIARLETGGGYDAAAIAAKRQAEVANSAVFSSLQRMMGDPQNQQEGLERAAAIANGNQRLTRALTIVALHLTPGAPLAAGELAAFGRLADEALAALAGTLVPAAAARPADLDRLIADLEAFAPPAADAGRRDGWVFAQLLRAGTELTAMLLAVETAPRTDGVSEPA